MPKIRIDIKHCKGCGLCAAFCPKGVLAISSSISRMGLNPVEVVDQGNCSGCLNCATMCPDACIEIIEVESAGKAAKNG